jgi:N-acetylneuraminate lyase
VKFTKFNGMIAATHTPMRADYALNLKPIERLADHLIQNGVAGVFVGGTTGEGQSLTMEERRRMAGWWAEVVKGTSLKLIVHVGQNCLTDARELAGHAEKIRADAIAAVCPSFYKPANVERLVSCCQMIAGGAPKLPFYLYDIPAWTGVQLSLPEFLGLGRKRIPTLAGVKFTHGDLAQLQQCLCAGDGGYDVLFGCDDVLLAGLTLGVKAAVGSTYNFAAPIYKRLIEAFVANDFETARMEQARSVELIETLSRYGFMSAAKVVMALVGIDCGPTRLPLAPLTPTQQTSLRQELERIEFFEWIGPYHVHARRPVPKKASSPAK